MDGSELREIKQGSRFGDRADEIVLHPAASREWNPVRPCLTRRRQSTIVSCQVDAAGDYREGDALSEVRWYAGTDQMVYLLSATLTIRHLQPSESVRTETKQTWRIATADSPCFLGSSAGIILLISTKFPASMPGPHCSTDGLA